MINPEGIKILFATWLKDGRKKALSHLSSTSKSRYLYIKELIRVKEAKIEEAKSEDHDKLLEEYIGLMQKFDPEEVEVEVKKPFYLPRKLIPILKESNNLPALAMLHRLNKDFQIALSLYIKLITTSMEELTTKPSQFNQVKEKFTKYLGGALEVSYQSSIAGDTSNTIWTTILDCIYEKLAQLHSDNRLRGHKLTVIQFLTSQIKDILSEISQYASPSGILNQISKGHGDLEIGSYRSIISSLSSVCKHSSSLLKTALSISARYSKKELIKYYIASTQGFLITKNVCWECKTIVTEEIEIELVSFTCGHLFHLDCMKERDKCKYCFKISELFEDNKGENTYGEDDSGRCIKITNRQDAIKSSVTSIMIKPNKEKLKKLRRLEVFDRTRTVPFKLFKNRIKYEE